MSSQITPPGSMAPVKAMVGARNRARAARLARRAAQFNKFRLVQLNLVPLVDTFVSVVFFTLVTATVGELAPVVRGVNLPESRVGQPALQQITLGIGPQVTLAGRPVMSTLEAAQARSDNPAQPLLIPPLYAALRAKADSIRALTAYPERSIHRRAAGYPGRPHDALRPAVSRYADGPLGRFSQFDAAGQSRCGRGREVELK
jgi:hypothetical protein